MTWPGHPDSDLMRRRSLREVVADRRAARAGPPPGATLTAWLRTRPRPARPAGSGRPAAPQRGAPPRRRRASRARRAGSDRARRPGPPRRARPARQRWRDWWRQTTTADPPRLGLKPRPQEAGASGSLSRFEAWVPNEARLVAAHATAAALIAHCSSNFLCSVGFELRPLPGAMRDRPAGHGGLAQPGDVCCAGRGRSTSPPRCATMPATPSGPGHPRDHLRMNGHFKRTPGPGDRGDLALVLLEPGKATPVWKRSDAGEIAKS